MRFSRSEVPSENVSVSEPERTISHSPVPIQPQAWHETNQRVAGRERAIALRAALNGGVIAAILSLVPAGFIVGMPLGGFLAVLFHRRRSWRAEPSVASALRLGALAGVFASVIFEFVRGAAIFAADHGAELKRQILARAQLMEGQASDPQQRQFAEQMIEYLKTPQGMTLAIIMGAIFLAIIFVVLSGLGGMLSASLLRRKGPRG